VTLTSSTSARRVPESAEHRRVAARRGEKVSKGVSGGRAVGDVFLGVAAGCSLFRTELDLATRSQTCVGEYIEGDLGRSRRFGSL
jgi:hypothetical protein